MRSRKSNCRVNISAQNDVQSRFHLITSLSLRVLRTHRSVKTGGNESDDQSAGEEELLRVPVPLAVSSDGLLTIRSSQKRRTAKRVHEPMLELHLQALEVSAEFALLGWFRY